MHNSRQSALEVGAAGSHVADAMKVELLYNTLWIQYVALAIGFKLSEFNKEALGRKPIRQKMFDKGVPLRRKRDLQNVNVHPGDLGDSTNATAGLENVSHVIWWTHEQA